jgi:uncharacterized protein YhdP
MACTTYPYFEPLGRDFLIHVSCSERVVNLDLEIQLKDERIKSQIDQIARMESTLREQEAKTTHIESKFKEMQLELQRTQSGWSKDQEELQVRTEKRRYTIETYLIDELCTDAPRRCRSGYRIASTINFLGVIIVSKS